MGNKNRTKQRAEYVARIAAELPTLYSPYTEVTAPAVPPPIQTYQLAYCIYDPDGQYWGHRLKDIRATDITQAEAEAHNHLNSLAGKGKWEYRLTLVTEHSSHRVYDTKTQRRT